MTRITDERLKELRDTWSLLPPSCRETAGALDELIERRAAQVVEEKRMHIEERFPSGEYPAGWQGWFRDAPAPGAEAAAPTIPLEWSKAVQEAYGWLWHVNTEPMAPVPLLSPEAASYEARKCLRELLTTGQRGEAINAVSALAQRKVVPHEPPPCEQQSGLSVAGEPQAERNQCDGCARGLPISGGMHRAEGEGPFSCSAHRYQPGKHPEELQHQADAELPAVPAVSDDVIDAVSKALRRAWQLGQTYWQQADSESYVQNAKSEVTHAKFNTLVEETQASLAAAPTAPAVPAGWRPEVVAFADAMERKLRANDHKPGWKRDSADSLRERVGQEMEEFDLALRSLEWAQRSNRTIGPEIAAAATEIAGMKSRILDEAADVANMLMMVCDVVGVLAAAPAAPAVEAPPKMTDAEIHRLCGTTDRDGMMRNMARRIAHAVETARDEQWRAALGGKA